MLVQMTLFSHQQESLGQTKDFTVAAYYLNMGLGKTLVGAEKAMYYNNWPIWRNNL